jgi:hypothetical protein
VVYPAVVVFLIWSGLLPGPVNDIAVFNQIGLFRGGRSGISREREFGAESHEESQGDGNGGKVVVSRRELLKHAYDL